MWAGPFLRFSSKRCCSCFAHEDMELICKGERGSDSHLPQTDIKFHTPHKEVRSTRTWLLTLALL